MNTLNGITAKIRTVAAQVFAWPVIILGKGTDGNFYPLALNTDGTPASASVVSRYRNVALDATAQTAAASLSALLLGYNFINRNNYPAYVKLYDAPSGSVAVGTTTPVTVLAVPPSGALLLENNNCAQGIFSAAISIVATQNIDDSDATTPDIALYAEILYK